MLKVGDRVRLLHDSLGVTVADYGKQVGIVTETFRYSRLYSHLCRVSFEVPESVIQRTSPLARGTVTFTVNISALKPFDLATFENAAVW